MLLMPSKIKTGLASSLSVLALLAVLPGVANAQSSSKAAAAAAADPVVARIGSVTIGQKEVEQLFSAMPASERAVLKANQDGLNNWLRQRLASEALLAEARSKGFNERPEVKARVELAKREVVARVVGAAYLDSVVTLPAGYPSEAETKAAYEQARGEFKIPVTYQLSQIFLAVPAADPKSVESKREEAKKLAAEARKGDFAALARTRSQDRITAARGGEVGRLAIEQVMPELRAEVQTLKAGEVSEPLQSSSGFHIVKMVEIVPAHNATLEEIKPRLQATMRQQRQQKMAQEYASNLVAPSKMSIDNAAVENLLKKLN